MGRDPYANGLAQLLLGRPLQLDEEEVLRTCEMDPATGILHLRAFLEQTHQLQMERHRFRFTPGGAVRLVIIGQHALGIARALASRCDLPVLARLHPPHIPSWWDELQEEAGPSADYLILEGEAPQDQVVEELSARGLRAIKMQAVEFGGLHPDAVFVPKSPLAPPGVGGWHSRQVLTAFLEGRSQADCLASFASDTYTALSYYDRFDRDLAILRAREVGCEIAIADRFVGAIRNQPLLRNPRDGTQPLYDLYVDALAPLLDLRPSNRHALGSESVTAPVWPILPEIASHHRLAYDTPLYFVRETEAYGLQEMIRRSYDSYRWWPRPTLAQLTGLSSGDGGQ